jgi:CHASE2 domain-containing sensor protein
MNTPKARTARSYRVAPLLRRWAVVVLFGAGAALLAVSPLHRLERSWGLENLYALRGERPMPPRMVVVAIHGAAARALGVPARPDRWPRALHAELLTLLQARGARVVAFDLLFDRVREPPGDERLAHALRQAGNGVLVAYLRRDMQRSGDTLVAVDQLVQPLPVFSEAALATAPFALVKSPEGVLSYLAFAPEGDDHPSLPLVLAAQMRPDAFAPLLGALPAPAPSAPHTLLGALRRAALARPAAFPPPPGPGAACCGRQATRSS